ncbi:aspartate ammonia-lyase [Pistricoccus aurantiacus]|uniref:aspartate ammonia-lyase n=1 Tax=Pistricoccus aurantiacus TaxID=1883414 RepID=UPI003636C7E4
MNDNDISDQGITTVTQIGDTDKRIVEVLQEYGCVRRFSEGDWISQEGTPREWFAVLLSGELELLYGRYGDPRRVGLLGPGAMVFEGFLMDDQNPHRLSTQAVVAGQLLVLDTVAKERLQQERADFWNDLILRVAMRLRARLRETTARMVEHGEPDFAIGTTRMERDSLGVREIPADAYYGVQTLRAMENFPISGQHLNHYGNLCTGLAMVKKAAAQANHELGVLEADKAEAIAAACDEIIQGKLRRHFVLDMIQGGAGTSTNMNANEVIANRALELLGHQRGDYTQLHPLDHVNLSQSTNDAYPTSVKIAVLLTVQQALNSLGELSSALKAKSDEFSDVLKMGRTENQDAVPMTLGQEFGAYAGMVASARRALEHATLEMHRINMGATAIGTGLNSPAGYARLVTDKLTIISGLPLSLADDLVEATQDSGAFAYLSGAMKRVAIQVSKICNDLRWLSSGPRAGLNEINLPPMQPGSSIMPGKVNPVVPEMVNQVCYQIIGFDATIGIAAEASELELNMAEPIMAYDLLQGMTILNNALIVLTNRCVRGITANRDVCQGYVQRSIGLVTALNPVLGYERSSLVAKEALKTGGSVYDLVIAKGWLSQEQLDELLEPSRMTSPMQPRT